MKNELKKRMYAGEQLYGTWITVESPIMTELMSSFGFDYFVIDRSTRRLITGWCRLSCRP